MDAIAQQALAALYISRIADILGEAKTVVEFNVEYTALKDVTNRIYWDDTDEAYFDLESASLQDIKVLPPASF